MNVELVIFRDPVSFRGSIVGSLHAVTHRVTITLDEATGILYVEDLVDATKHAFPFHGNVKQIIAGREAEVPIPEPEPAPASERVYIAKAPAEVFTSGITRRTRPVKA